METEFVTQKYKIGDGGVERSLFVKQHIGNDDAKPNERTLYIVNVPQFFSKKCIKAIFSECGPIEKVYIQSKPSSGVVVESSKYFALSPITNGPKVSYIVYKRPGSVLKALKCTKVVKSISEDLILKSGKEKWAKKYNSLFVDTKDLLKEIESFMSEFDKKTEEAKLKDKEIEGVADEDGWVTITKQSKKPKIVRNEFTSKRLLEKQKRAQAKQTLVNFYKCQLQNAKMDQMMELRKKFESDKKRLALMKSGRKFKPL